MPKTLKPLRLSAPILKRLTILICASLSGPAMALSIEPTNIALAEPDNKIQFNDMFLASGTAVDMSRFERPNLLSAGSYIADIIVNGKWRSRANVVLAASPNGSVQPCFDRQLLDGSGVDMSKLDPAVIAKLRDGEKCLRLSDMIDQATANFDMADLRLDLSIPHASLTRNARGYISPELWDVGVTAGMLGYDFNTFQYSNRQAGNQNSTTQNYLGIKGGFNIQDWRVRHNGTYSWGSEKGGEYRKAQTYAQRDLTGLKSQLTIGESFTSSEMFDTVGYRGIRIASDDRMLPDSMRGYAPIVRGQANSNARVTIRQNDFIIYENTVAPGPFEINDLYPTGFGGDLKVTVTESDGSEHTFLMPFAGIPQLLRENSNRFSATIARVRDQSLQHLPLFVQGTWQHGISNDLTGYGGAIISEGYNAGLIGTAWNTSYGAFSLDLSVAETQLAPLDDVHGASGRLSYSKLLTDTNTNFSLAAYRYSTGGYFGFADAIRARDYERRDLNSDLISRQRSRFQVTINQVLKDNYGSVYLTGFTQDYWNRSGRNLQFQAGYSNNWGRLSYSVTAARQRNNGGNNETSVYLTMSIPLGDAGPSINLTGTAGRDGNGNNSLQSTLSGSLGEQNQFSYGATSTKQSGTNGSSSSRSINGQYTAPFANLSASAGVGQGYRQSGFGVSGAVIAHPGGVTLAQQLGETIGIVEALDAGGAQVTSSPGVQLDRRGYAAIPYLSPYHQNTVELDPKGLSLDVELESTSQLTAPRSGAVVMLKFPTSTARSAMITSRLENGDPLPFGASVFDEHENNLGIVAQNSRIFIRGAEDNGKLIVRWGPSSTEQCHITYKLTDVVRKEEGNTSISSVARATSDTNTDTDTTNKTTGGFAKTEGVCIP